MATVTEANPDYVGSITIDAHLAQLVGLWEGEKVLVTSHTSGARLETYVILAEARSGIICINGPAARLIGVGEMVVIMGFELSEIAITPSIVHVDHSNLPVDTSVAVPEVSLIRHARSI